MSLSSGLTANSTLFILLQQGIWEALAGTSYEGWKSDAKRDTSFKDGLKRTTSDLRLFPGKKAPFSLSKEWMQILQLQGQCGWPRAAGTWGTPPHQQQMTIQEASGDPKSHAMVSKPAGED